MYHTLKWLLGSVRCAYCSGLLNGTAPRLSAPTTCAADHLHQFVSFLAVVSNHPIPLNIAIETCRLSVGSIFMLGVHLKAIAFGIQRQRLHATSDHLRPSQTIGPNGSSSGSWSLANRQLCNVRKIWVCLSKWYNVANPVLNLPGNHPNYISI